MKSLRISIIILACLFIPVKILSQDKDGSRVKWMSLPEAYDAVKQQPRPILLDFYTDWCGWCKRMMSTTYADEALANYINQNFYPVKFNAEGKDTVTFEGETFMPASLAPKTAHPLAVKLLQGKLMYPTTLFLNAYDPVKNEFQVKMLVPGYLDKQKIEPILVYTLENVFRSTALEDFTQTFNTAFYDTTISGRIQKLKWLMPEQVFDGNFNDSLKRLVFLHTPWCNSCRVMERGVFTDSALTEILTKFTLIDFNPENNKPLFWNNKLYQKLPDDKFPFHPLALELTKKNFILPTVAILDEQGQPIDAIPFYLGPSVLAEILDYYGNNFYKSMNWADYRKNKMNNK